MAQPEKAKPVYRKLAEAFVREETLACFALLGDGNMHWAAALAESGSVQMIYGRHENAVISMAAAYARATGEVGVATVTCGPGITQIGTALTVSSRAKIPLVIFAGEAPISLPFHNQRIEQGPFVAACGAHYIAAHSPGRMLDYVHEAFLTARQERRPVVIGIPYDLQKLPFAGTGAYVPSKTVLPVTGRMQPDSGDVRKAVEMMAASQRVVVLGGRGVGLSDAGEACIELADRCGGLLATTLPSRGMFDASPYCIGITGGFCSQVARKLLSECDLVVLVGASLAHHASLGGTLFPQARVIQIDTNPVGRNQGQRVADLYLRADARDGVRAVLQGLVQSNRTGGNWRTPQLAKRIAEEPLDDTMYDVGSSGLDPRLVAGELDRLIPRDWELVSGSGHCSYFFSNMRSRGPGKFHAIREFGVIGDGLAYAIGVAVARPDSRIVLMDGDGSLLMHVQELETVRRHGLDILVCVFNDGAYGSEVHKLRAEGLTDHGAVFGRGDLAQLARGFGLEGAMVTELDQLPALIAEFQSAGGTRLIDIHVSDKVLSPNMRRLTT